MTEYILRIHPSIGLSRVGNSEEYYLAPESIAALDQPQHPDDATKGGLPIVPGTDHEIISHKDLRDANGAFKRQASRFRIFAYPESEKAKYPAQRERELTIGDRLGDREITDILWTVHVANKKAAWFESDDDHGATAYDHGQTPVLRNLRSGLDPHNSRRLTQLVIDPGPRAIQGRDATPVAFDAATPASLVEDGAIVRVVDYPKSFPDMHFPAGLRDEPQGPIETLGELRTDEDGRLIVTGGFGKSTGWKLDDSQKTVPIAGPVNNDQWFDDTSDGPVSATIVFDDGSTLQAHGAWAITTDPSYAPQTLNVVSLWDEAYDTFVRKLGLDPQIYRNGRYDPEYRPSFPDQLQPIFKATQQQMWNTYLPEFATNAHRSVGSISAEDDPNATILAGLAFVRAPDPGDEHSWKARPSDAGVPLMPLSLGDASAAGGKSFLAPTYTQYFFLERWADGNFAKQSTIELGEGEYLDRASLQNCLGGRFSPGIDMTWIIRETSMYVEDWREGSGPFRIHHKRLDYARARVHAPFLSLGWIPRHADVENAGLEPGDASKFMALPWHADYNSCAIHQTSPNPQGSDTLFWSWPAQRPVTVYVAEDYKGELPPQRYSVRGPGTYPGANSPDDKHDLADAGRFWQYRDMLDHWQDIGVIVQTTIIDDGRTYPDDLYLEVQSKLGESPPELADPKPWPFIAGNDTATRKSK